MPEKPGNKLEMEHNKVIEDPISFCFLHSSLTDFIIRLASLMGAKWWLWS